LTTISALGKSRNEPLQKILKPVGKSRMNQRLLFSGVVLTTLAFDSAKADLFDNFDGYADKAAFDAAWTVSVGTGLTLTNQFLSSPNAVVNPGTLAQQSRHAMAPISSSILDFSFSFYDFQTGNSRDYGMVYSRAGGGAWTDSLNNLLGIGKNNNITTSSYYGRVSTATGAVYGDGAASVTATWFALTGAANRSVGWHTARITGADDPNNAGKVIYYFYIDDVLGGSVGNLSGFDYNWTVLGSGLSTAPIGIAFDDLAVTTVPEPSTVSLVMLGMGALLLVRKFRS
jgi:hypothetical protein